MGSSAQARARLIVRRRPGDLDTPVSTLMKLGADTPGHFLFESIHGGERLGRYSFIGLDPDLWWRVVDGVAETATDHAFSEILSRDTDPLESLKTFADGARAEADEELPPMASGAFGTIGYDMIQYYEPIKFTSPRTLIVPDAIMLRPRLVIIFDHLYQEMILVARQEAGVDASVVAARLDDLERRLQTPPPLALPGRDRQPVPFESNTSRARYFEMVEQAKAYTEAGDIFQVVPSQRFTADFPYRSISLYRALRRLNPSAFMFHMALGSLSLVGSSPEILVRLRQSRVAIRPIAGTRPRTGDPVIDKAAEESLLADEKELSEHLMLLDLGRNDVGRIAAYGSVEVTEEFIVERYSHVMHIVSHVEGNLRDGMHAVDALMAGFPAGTVSGAPKIRAMEIIDELETARRGIYGGAVGYFGWNGDMDTCIALRTAVLEGGRMHVQAGGGVVHESDPQYEYDETLHKANALIRAAERAAEFETPQ
jgi:anthranilate synthase component I